MAGRTARFALLVALASLVSGSAAVAASAPAKPIVIFFGGYSSTATDMRNWVSAASRAPTYGQDFTFEAVPYPAIDSPVESDAVAAAAATITATAATISASPDRSFIIVGHSSAAGIAANVVERVKNRRNVKLIILDDGVDDGFKPPPGFNSSAQVECWSVVNGALVSFNRGAAMAFCRNYHEMQASGCRTDVCLHFAIVNANALPDLTYDTAFAVAGDGSTGGYRNLKVNLSWLDLSIGF